MIRRIVLAVIVGLFMLAPVAYGYDWSGYSTDQLIETRHEIDSVLRSRLDRMTPEERDRLVGRESTLKQPFQSPRREIDPDTTFTDEWQRRVRALPREDQPRYILPPQMSSPRTDTPPEVAK